MSEHTTDQCVSDVFAYIDTLDPGEALGEILHMGRCYSNALRLLPEDKAKEMAAVFLPVIIATAERIKPAVQHVDPPHGTDVLHSCTLLHRSIHAVRGEQSG